MEPGRMDVGQGDRARRRRFWLWFGPLVFVGLSALIAFVAATILLVTGPSRTTLVQREPFAPLPYEPPPAEPAEPFVDEQGRRVSPPDWRTRPAPNYPEPAQRNGVEAGHATLSCEVLSDGRIGVCDVVDEGPPGQGFGDAALSSMRDARVRPQSIDGFQTDGRIRFTVRFRLQ